MSIEYVFAEQRKNKRHMREKKQITEHNKKKERKASCKTQKSELTTNS